VRKKSKTERVIAPIVCWIELLNRNASRAALLLREAIAMIPESF